MYIYLDESGDLGFNFEKKGTTNHFIITLLRIKTREDNKRISKAIERTIKRKVRRRKTKKTSQLVLRGYNTTISVKRYLFNQIGNLNFDILSYIVDKRKAFKYLNLEDGKSKEKLYDLISQKLIEKCKLEEERDRIVVFLHRRKSKGAVSKFNSLLRARCNSLKVPLNIWHRPSYETKGLQAACLFCWGIFRKFERRDFEWYVIFRRKIIFQTDYIPKKGL